MAKAKRVERPRRRRPAAAAQNDSAETAPARGYQREIKAADVQGLKYFKSLRPLLARLHDIGTRRDAAGNRDLHMDQYCLLILLWLYSPVLTSLRGLQQASDLNKVRKRLGVGRASLGSLSESVSIFDPEPLKEIAAEPSDRIPQPKQGHFDGVEKTIIAVDGSVTDTVVRVARLAWLPKSGGQANCGYRLHTQFEVLRGTVHRLDTTGSKPKGEADERAVLARTIEPDHCYIIDRGYAKFTLGNEIHQVQSSYVCRVRDNSAHDVVEQRNLTDADRAAGVLSDKIVQFGNSSKKSSRPDHVTRLVVVAAPAHTSRGKSRKKGSSTGPDCDGKLRIATDMLDIPAELIAELYRLRWVIELFFRMFKQLLGCRHLLSTKQNGVEIQTYLAIIASLLILIYTGRGPTKRTFEMICLYMAGWASLEELARHIEKLKPQIV